MEPIAANTTAKQARGKKTAGTPSRKKRKAVRLSSPHLLGLESMPREDIELILQTAVSFKEILERPIKKVPPLRGMTVVNLFYEPSTRTRISFELAEKRLSADVVSFTTSTSSVQKGESLRDTIQNIESIYSLIKESLDEDMRRLLLDDYNKLGPLRRE